MKKIEQKISPAGFDLLQRSLMQADGLGYGPDLAVRTACARVGLYPEDGTVVTLVVDYSLDGPVWPFMDWPRGWIKGEPDTWR